MFATAQGMIVIMDSFLNKFKSQSKSSEPLPPGMHHFRSAHDDPIPYRLHLRLEKDGHGLLILNASTILHLNPTAAEYAYHLIHQTPDDQVAEQITQRYRVSKQQAVDDMRDMRQRINEIILGKASGVDAFLNFDHQSPDSIALSAPYRLDCAVTYRMQENNRNPSPEEGKAELGTNDWKLMLDKAWQAGIPHIIFTGGEPTLREDLPNLIRQCEHNGQVAGMVTAGIKLGTTRYLSRLLQAGLDQVFILMQTDDSQIWDAITSLLYWSEILTHEIMIAVHITLSKYNVTRIRALLNRLAETGVHNLSLSVDDKALAEDLFSARERADDLHFNLVWNLPVPYAQLNPVALELEAAGEVAQRSGPARASLYVQPDGTLHTEKRSKHILGNLLSDPWHAIWSFT